MGGVCLCVCVCECRGKEYWFGSSWRSLKYLCGPWDGLALNASILGLTSPDVPVTSVLPWPQRVGLSTNLESLAITTCALVASGLGEVFVDKRRVVISKSLISSTALLCLDQVGGRLPGCTPLLESRENLMESSRCEVGLIWYFFVGCERLPAFETTPIQVCAALFSRTNEASCTPSP